MELKHDTPIVKFNLQDAGCFWEMGNGEGLDGVGDRRRNSPGEKWVVGGRWAVKKMVMVIAEGRCEKGYSHDEAMA